MLGATAAALILLIIGLIYYGPWQELCTAMARQTIFEKRDALFDLALDGRLTFDDPNYRAIRRALEQIIRFSHELTLWRYFVLRQKLKMSGELGKEPGITASINAIKDDATRKEVNKLVEESHLALLGMVFLKSPVLMVVLIPIIALVFLVAVVLSAQGRVTQAIKDAGNAVQLESELG
jgi:hypothetical protein